MFDITNKFPQSLGTSFNRDSTVVVVKCRHCENGPLYLESLLGTRRSAIDLVTVFDAILTRRQTREKLQCLYENLMSNSFRKTAVLKKI